MQLPVKNISTLFQTHSEYTQVTMAERDALLEKFQAIIKAEVSTITKNSDTNTAEIKRSITDIKKDISSNTD